jgi:hypothetical protein
MADREDTRARGELPLRRSPQGEHVKYIGSRAQLLAAGIVDPDTPFPGDPGQRKGSVRFADDPRGIQGIWKSTPGRYSVNVRLPDAELAEYRRKAAENEAQWTAEREREREGREAARKLEDAPRSFEDYRTNLAEPMSRVLRAVLLTVEDRQGGYRYAPDVVAAMAIHAQAIEGLLMTGTIEFDGAERDAERARLHAVAARGDLRFDRFLRKAKARA